MTLTMLYSLLPILIIAFGCVLSLLLIAWRRSQHLILFFTLAILTSALIASLLMQFDVSQAVQVTLLLKVDGYGHFAFILVLLASIAVSLLSSRWLQNSIEVHDEYFVLLQLVVLGAGIIVMSDHFGALFLGFELLSIALVGLVGYCKVSQYSVESSFKYLILSATASSFMLLGIAFIYSQTGVLSFNVINEQISYGVFYQAGLLLFLVGIAFKLSLAPFHFWTPDVYQGSPTPVTLLLASVSKVAMFVVLMKCWFSQLALFAVVPKGAGIFFIMGLLAVLSMLVGNVLALKQQNVKRLLAYSSIAHMGYLLIVLMIIAPQSISLAWQSALFYLSAYVLATVSIFMALQLTQNNDELMGEINEWQGLFWRSRMLALLIIVAILSLAGIPLTMGFIGKFYLLNLAVEAQQWWLIAALIIGSGIGLFYYLRIIFVLFLTEKNVNVEQIKWLNNMSFFHRTTIFVLTFMGVFLGVFPDSLALVLTLL
ncbi:MAG: NADH-quinone oxidoreductase subunit N [Litorilituus sp.]|jgi:NADH-quinone oxidoreductase subunit N|nr:NADH-quinone oxidoreductase subunit N [Litorilituus sp.]